MADLIPIQRRVGPSVRTPNRVSPGAFQNANPSAGLAQAASAASNVALTVDRKEQDRLERERQTKLGALENQVRERVSLALQENYRNAVLNAPEGGGGFFEGFKQNVEEIRQAELDRVGLDDPDARDLVDTVISRNSLPFLGNAQEFEAVEKVNLRGKVRENSLKALGNAIFSNPDDVDTFRAEGIAAIQAASGDLTPDGQRELNDKWNKTASMAAFNGMLETDPYQALDDAKSKRFDKHWAPDDKALAINAAQSEIKRREAEARAKQAEQTDFRVADLEIAVRRGQAGQMALDEAREAGLFDSKPQKYAQLTTIADTVLNDQIEAANEAAALQQKLASGFGLDTQAEADNIWAQREARLAEDDEQATLSHVATFAENTGFAPTKLKQRIKNAERVDNAEQLAFAAQAHDVVRETTPGVDTGAGDRVDLVSSLVRDAGMGYDEASTQVLAQLPDSAILSERQAALKEQKKKGGTINFDEEAANRIPDMEGFFGGNNTVPGMAFEMERRYDQLFLLSGDKETALSAAARKMGEQWGPSVFRDGAAMRLPPERFMPKTAGNLSSEDYKAIVDQEIEATLGQILSADGAQTPDEVAADATMTVERSVDGRKVFVNLPLIADGEQRTEEQALSLFDQDASQHVGIFNTDEQAAKAAARRARRLAESAGKTAPGTAPTYRLEPDIPESKRRISLGQPPAYRVMVENDFGAMIPLADTNGDLVLYTLPDNDQVAESDVFKKSVSEQEQELEHRGKMLTRFGVVDKPSKQDGTPASRPDGNIDALPLSP